MNHRYQLQFGTRRCLLVVMYGYTFRALDHSIVGNYGATYKPSDFKCRFIFQVLLAVFFDLACGARSVDCVEGFEECVLSCLIETDVLTVIFRLH